MIGPPPMRKKQRLVDPPKNIKEVPRYLLRVVSGFFTRLFYIIRLVWETGPWLLILMSLLCLVIGVLPVIGAVISRNLLNEVNNVLNSHGILLEDLLTSVTGVLSGVAFFLLLQFGYEMLNRILNRLRLTLYSLAGEMVSNHIKLKLMHKAKTVDLASFDDPLFYERLENANREAGMRPINILTATFDVISCCISALSFIVLLANIGWIAPVLVLILAAPTAIINYVFRNKSFWYVRFHSKERRQMNYYSSVVTDKDLVKEMRIMDLSDTFIGKYKATFKTYFKGLKKLILQEGIWQIIGSLVSLTANCALFFYVAYHVVGGNLTVGDYSMYAGALTSIGGYATTVIASTAIIYEGTLFIENVREFMKEKVTICATSPESPRVPERHIPHTITLEHVSFRYPGTTKDVIKDLSLTIRGGEKVVLVGLNGAGKTTLIKLITRLYDPTEGRILLDGHDLREYDPKELYRIFGIIFQDFGRYALTIRENIAIGDVSRTVDEEAVKEAAEKSNAAPFIDKLKEGYDTPLMRWFEESGMELSIGQWQKLSIARAFYKDSDILILDEPTASLDALAEQEVFDQIAALSENKLVIFVSHRLSSATTADKIVVIDGGYLVELGNHKELMEKGGTYHHLFSTQASHYQESMGDSTAMPHGALPPPPAPF